MKALLTVVGIFVVLIGGVVAYAQYNKQVQVSKISSFEECAKAGFPIMDSYPGQCRTSDGRLFVQDIGNELEFSDLILIENPRPNQKVSSPLIMKGRARGTWYFEANFPVELLDANDNSLVTSFATALGEWMTEDFVPFRAELSFTKPSTPTGKLIIKNANPSGLPENEKELIIPVSFTE